MTWKQLTERDCREWKLSAINPHDRCTWRSGVRSAMHAASQLSVLILQKRIGSRYLVPVTPTAVLSRSF